MGFLLFSLPNSDSLIIFYYQTDTKLPHLVTWPSSKARVCKTLIRGCNSHRDLFKIEESGLTAFFYLKIYLILLISLTFLKKLAIIIEQSKDYRRLNDTRIVFIPPPYWRSVLFSYFKKFLNVSAGIYLSAIRSNSELMRLFIVI